MIIRNDILNLQLYIEHNKFAKNGPDAAAKSINFGTDIDLGDMYFPQVFSSQYFIINIDLSYINTKIFIIIRYKNN